MDMLNWISGGVCAPEGFTAAGVHAGVKAGSNAEKKDLMLLYSEKPCAAWGMYTQNVVKAASVLWTREALQNGTAQAVVANSGNANACCEQSGENAKRMARTAAKLLGIAPEDVVVGSTGVIGQTINIAAIEQALPGCAEQLSRAGSDAAAQAIMTTDTVKKEEAVAVEIGGKTVTIGGISKGSGMIHPNMGTMLCFLTTDCAISKGLVRMALQEAVRGSFPTLLQWDARWGCTPYGGSILAITGCGPTALSVVACGLTGDASLTPAAIAAWAQRQGYAGADGTSWETMRSGCEHFGLYAQELSLTEAAVFGALEAGQPIICSMRPGDFTTAGHFIVLTGTQDGLLCVVDPNSPARSASLWEYSRLEPQIKNLWAYTA